MTKAMEHLRFWINRQAARDELHRAAIAWWKGRRPLKYNEKQHLENPTINTVTQREHRLAKAVAKIVVANKVARKLVPRKVARKGKR